MSLGVFTQLLLVCGSIPWEHKLVQTGQNGSASDGVDSASPLTSQE